MLETEPLLRYIGAMFRRSLYLGLIVCTLLLPAAPVTAQSASQYLLTPNPSGLPIPRWVSIRAGEANLRTGPGDRYPIDWVLQFRNLPVEIVGEFKHWRKVRIQDNTVGWVHKSLISGNRMATVAVAQARVLQKPDYDKPVTALVEEGVVVSLNGCSPHWCRVTIASHGVKGWIPREALWGLHPGELIER